MSGIRNRTLSLGVAGALAASLGLATPVLAQNPTPSADGLAAETLAQGESVRAIALLQAELERHPTDPAVQINLGIAYAQAGGEAEARRYFEAALANRDAMELETADGRVTNSRYLARHALAMLGRGEFQPTRSGASQLTMRDE